MKVKSNNVNSMTKKNGMIAWMALVTVGSAKSLAEIKDFIPMEKSLFPNESNHKVYQTLYPTFKNLYISLRAHYKDLSDFQKGINELNSLAEFVLSR